MAACDLNTLVAETPCYDQLSDTEKRRAFVYLLAKTLLAEGGADYTAVGDLRAAVRCWCVGGARLESFKAQVAQDLAVRAGAYGSPPTIAQVRSAIKCWCDVGGGELKAMEDFILCSLFKKLVA